MIDLAPVIARIQAAGIFKDVGGAAKAMTALAKQSPGDGPYAYVVPMTDRAGPMRADDVPYQRVESLFGVLIMVRAAADATGEASTARLFPLQTQLLALLHGWTPGENLLPLSLAGGEIVDFTTGALWWIERFATSYGAVPELATLNAA